MTNDPNPANSARSGSNPGTTPAEGAPAGIAAHANAGGRGPSACPFLRSLAALIPTLATAAVADAQSIPGIAPAPSAQKAAQAKKDPRTGEEAVAVRATVVGEARPGATVRVAVAFTVHPEWHIYWSNPGESGAPTHVELVLPAGCRGTGPGGAAVVDYPTPKVFEHGETVFGYEGTVVLSLAVQLPEELPASLPVTVRSNWLVCKERCLMGRNEATVDLLRPVGADDASVQALAASLVAVPRPLPAAWSAELREVDEERALLVVRSPKQEATNSEPSGTAERPARLLLADTPGVSLASGFVADAKDGSFEVELRLSRESALGKPFEVAGIVTLEGASGNKPRAYSFRLAIPPGGGGPAKQ